MKIYVVCPKPLNLAVERIINSLFTGNTIVKNRGSADLVITDEKNKVIRGYRPEQHYLIISFEEILGLPDNAKWVHASQFVSGILQYISEISSDCDLDDETKKELAIGVEIQPSNCSTHQPLHVLVIDDTIGNLEKAVEQLHDECVITLADGYDKGIELIEKNRYDVVLTDLQMPIGLHHKALSVQNLDISKTVHNGFLIVFMATAKGAQCAVVTDASHHQDWVSASFDDLINQNHTVNGQKVLFFNNIGKNWRQALNKLLLD